jgi:glycosyltransferase involved in cell wall biosynthesis
MPTVSVVIPTFNRQNTILEAVNSALSQEWVDIEVIVIDDASTDETQEILLKNLDPRLRVLRLDENRGAQAARNLGIRSAFSEWVAFLDSDDVFLPGSIKSRLEIAEREHTCIVHGECMVLDEKRNLPQKFNTLPLVGQVYKTLLEKPGPTFPSLLVKRAVLLSIGGLDESLQAYQEWDTAIRLSEIAAFSFQPQPVFLYRPAKKDSISHQWKKSGEAYLAVVEKHKSEILRLAGKHALSRHYFRASRIFLQGGFFEEAIRTSEIALSNEPTSLLLRLYELLLRIFPKALQRFRILSRTI